MALERLLLRGTFVLQSGLHVGSGGADASVDSPLQRDSEGRVAVSAVSLANALKAPLVALGQIGYAPCSDAAIRSLFGYVPDSEDGGAVAARLHLRPAIADEAPADPRPLVGMDRRRRAAAPRVYASYETVPPGVRLGFTGWVEDPNVSDWDLLQIALQMNALFGWKRGGKSASGLGRMTLAGLERADVCVATQDELRQLCCSSGRDESSEPVGRWFSYADCKDLWRAADEVRSTRELRVSACASEMLLPQACIVELDLAPVAPLLIGTGDPSEPAHPEEPGDVDRQDLTSDAEPQEMSQGASRQEQVSDAEFMATWRLNGTAKWVRDWRYAPATSIKGVLRTRAERIIRELSRSRRGAGIYQSHPGACAITDADRGSPLQSCTHRFRGVDWDRYEGKRSDAVYRASCLACRLFGNGALRGRLEVSEFHLSDQVAVARDPIADHVAIDRFTGGAADKRKFDDRPLRPGGETVFSGRLTLRSFEGWQFGLLWHLLKDLCCEDLRFGAKTASGYGRMRGRIRAISFVTVAGSGLHRRLAAAGLNPVQCPGLPLWKTVVDVLDGDVLRLAETPFARIAAEGVKDLLERADANGWPDEFPASTREAT